MFMIFIGPSVPRLRHRVVMLGDASVGKTALVSQFMTSEYMHTYDASLGKSTVQSEIQPEVN